MTKRRPNTDVSPDDMDALTLEEALQGRRLQPSREQLAYIHNRYWELKRNMDLLCNRTDGWVRIVPKPDQDQLYLKFKYTSGPWDRHYIMAVVQTGQLPEGLMLLVHKLLQTDQGLHKPSKDRLYDAE